MARRGDSLIEYALLLGGGGYILYKYVLPRFMGGPSAVNATPNLLPRENVKAGTPALTSNTSLPLGIRNNNPGNIRYNILNQWTGQTGQEKGYAKFSAPQYGYRAMFLLLKRYINSYGLKTINQIGPRWAPSSENNTAAWSRNVATFSGIDINAPINPTNPLQMINLARGITAAENGSSFAQYFGNEAISTGWSMS
jgi:hypothetical protein